MTRGSLPRSFFRRDTVTVARALLGLTLVREIDGRRLSVRIVETEAYLGVADLAAHTVGGRRTPRNASMWGDGGLLYVYFTYGMHHCMNVVAGRTEDPVAVLLRAGEPIEGVEQMRLRRPKAKRDTDLCSGPAKLCQALDVTRAQDGLDLLAGGEMWIECGPGPCPADRIRRGPRIGVAYAGAWAAKPLRFCIGDNPHVSRGGAWLDEG